MNLEHWIHDLPRRLELGADLVDDLANGVWVQDDEDRERLFAVEAQLWRIAQSTRAAAGQPAELLPFLDRSLHAARSNVRMCLKLPVCEDEGIKLLEGVVRDLDEVIAELGLLASAGGARLYRVAAGGRS
jgi:hypothetical protein